MDFLRLSQSELLNARGKLVFIHTDKSDSGGAFELSEKCSLLLLLPVRLGATEVEIEVFNESFGELKLKRQAVFEDLKGKYDVYSARFPLTLLGIGLFFGKIRLKTLVGYVYAKKIHDELIFTVDTAATAFQLTVSEFKYSAPQDAYGGIIYHIFVDRFSRGGNVIKRDDAVMIEDWHSEIPEYPKYPGAYLENNSFFGGTLFGVIDKLDYLKSLGVSLIYLSPIFKSYSNHKYDTGDYMTVDESFGGEKALAELISKANERGIGIILDGVFNHTGADSIYFNKFRKYDSVGAYQTKDSPYFEWYDFQNHPDKYTCWWGIDILPRINPNNSSCREYLLSVVRKYAKMGIKGFRLDVADELSDDFISEIKRVLDEEKPSSILYGEVWEDASNKIAYGERKRYYLGRELDGVMNYPVRSAIISFLKYHDTEKIKYLFFDVFPNAPKRIRDLEMNLVGTHDTERILTALGGEESDGKTNEYLLSARLSTSGKDTARKLLFMSYAICATLPGIPSVFYGDEAGVQGYKDPFNRRTYPWGKEDKKILDFYKKIGKIRCENSVYARGGFKPLFINGDVLVFERYEGDLRFITAVNNSNKNFKFSFKNVASALISKQKRKAVELSPFSVEIIKTTDKSFAILD